MLRECSLPNVFHMSGVTCQVSCVTCKLSHVRCQVSCDMFIVGEGSVINGAYPVQFVMSRVCGFKPLFSEKVISLVKLLSFSKEDKMERFLALLEVLHCHLTVFNCVGPPLAITIHTLMASVVLRVCLINLISWYHKRCQKRTFPWKKSWQRQNQTYQQNPLTRFQSQQLSPLFLCLTQSLLHPSLL